MSRARELLLCAALAACARDKGNADAHAHANAHAHADANANVGADANANANVGANADAGAGARAWLTSTPLRGKSIGHTSVAFKLELSAGNKAVFKPASRRGPLRYKGEIAAHRLALALGVPNVPLALFRAFRAGDLASSLAGTPGAELFAREAIVTSAGDVRGALVPWIDKLDLLALESEPLWSKWRASLKRGRPVEDPELARQASVLVMFDWLTGNWDRWSGGNVGLDKAMGTVLFIDNDGAFFERPPKEALDRTWKLLEGIDRFSRAFVARVRDLDEAALGRAIGDERPGEPLLSAKVLASVEARRQKLLALVDAKIVDAGEAESMYFP